MNKKSNKRIKKAKLPLEKMTGREKDYVAAVLEEVRSNFSAFGESLDIFRQKTEDNFKRVDDNFKRIDDNFERLENKVDVVSERVDIVSERSDATFEEVGRIRVELTEMNGRLDSIEQEVASIKDEISALKTILTQKADLEFLKKLEVRIIKIEQHLKLSIA